MKEILPEEIDLLAYKLRGGAERPRIIFDHSFLPDFPETRKDTCVVKRTVDSYVGTRHDLIYLLWKTDKKLKHLEIDGTRASGDYLKVDKILEDKTDILIKYQQRRKWTDIQFLAKDYKISKKYLGLQ